MNKRPTRFSRRALCLHPQPRLLGVGFGRQRKMCPSARPAGTSVYEEGGRAARKRRSAARSHVEHTKTAREPSSRAVDLRVDTRFSSDSRAWSWPPCRRNRRYRKRRQQTEWTFETPFVQDALQVHMVEERRSCSYDSKYTAICPKCKHDFVHILQSRGKIARGALAK